MMASFTKWDTSLSGTLQAGPMGVPVDKVSLYITISFKIKLMLLNNGRS